jgi:hypothetical protein
MGKGKRLPMMPPSSQPVSVLTNRFRGTRQRITACMWQHCYVDPREDRHLPPRAKQVRPLWPVLLVAVVLVLPLLVFFWPVGLAVVAIGFFSAIYLGVRAGAP